MYCCSLFSFCRRLSTYVDKETYHVCSHGSRRGKEQVCAKRFLITEEHKANACYLPLPYLP